jgi:hypothetical protein
MLLDSTGNLGIGTTSPTSKLDVTGGNIELDPNQFISFNNAGTVPKIGYRTSGPQAGLDLYDNAGLLTISLGNQAVGIGDYAGGNALPVKGLAVSGNVGIGTSSPVAKLDIRGGIQLLNSSGSTSSATSASLMILGQNTLGGSSYHDFLYTRNTLSTATNPQKIFRLNNSGSIEIVNNAYTSVIFSLTDAGVLSTTGGGTSDIRTKQNIEYIYEDVSTTINKLKPAKFEFKNNPNVARHGFIAQDVLPIKPELVLGDGDKEAGTYGLDYDGILALTVKALQEANIKTKQLENKIETLEARLSVLENK